MKAFMTQADGALRLSPVGGGRLEEPGEGAVQDVALSPLPAAFGVDLSSLGRGEPSSLLARGEDASSIALMLGMVQA